MTVAVIRVEIVMKDSAYAFDANAHRRVIFLWFLVVGITDPNSKAKITA